MNEELKKRVIKVLEAAIEKEAETIEYICECVERGVKDIKYTEGNINYADELCRIRKRIKKYEKAMPVLEDIN